MSRLVGDGERAPASRSDRGQVAVETVGIAALFAVTVMMLWQALLAGYTLMLASRAADQAAREAALQLPSTDAAELGEAAGLDSLPDAWQDGADVEVSIEGDRTRAVVNVRVPLVVPGWLGTPLSLSSSSGARA